MKCKKLGLKGKTPPGPITSAGDLEGLCLTQGGDTATGQPDAKRKIAKACTDPKKGLAKALAKKCAGQDLAALFPGCGSADVATTAACLDRHVECRVCLAVNAADDLDRDCDLFDDGTANESCSEPPCVGAGRPTARSGAMGTYDPVDDRLYVFGGNDAASGVEAGCAFTPQNFLDDLWVYDTACNDWSEIDAAGGPGPRERGAAAYDSTRGRMLVFGGRFRSMPSGAYTLFNDVAAFDFATASWESLATSGTPPSPRFDTTAAYSPGDDALVVYGGNTSTSGAVLTPSATVHVLDLDTLEWSELATSAPAPAARLLHAAAIDPAANDLYVYGGGDANAFFGPFLGDLWVLHLDTGTWTELDDGTGTAPEARIGPSLAFDATTGDVHLFAGNDDAAVGLQNDLWSFDPQTTQTWTERIAPEPLDQPANGFCDFPPDFTVPNLTSPERRRAFVAGADPAARTWFIFGGQADCSALDDVWSLDVATHAWTEQLAPTTGEVCLRGPDPGSCTSLCE